MSGLFHVLTERQPMIYWTKINNKEVNSQVGAWNDGIIRRTGKSIIIINWIGAINRRCYH